MAKKTRMLSFLIVVFLLLDVFGSVAAQESPTPTPTDTLPTAAETPTGTASPEASETATPEPSATPTPEGTSTAEPSPTATLEEPSITTEQLAETILGGYGASFTTNVGQADAAVEFLGEAQGARFLFTSQSMVLLLPPPPPFGALASEAVPVGTPAPAFDPFESMGTPVPLEESIIVELQFVGANQGIAPSGQNQIPVDFSIYAGEDPSNHFEDIPLFESIIYPDLYPGIDLAFAYDSEFRLKSTFVVDPLADPGLIRLHYLGAEALAIDGEGTLIISTPAGDLYESAPIAYQISQGTRVDVPAAFALSGMEVYFTLGPGYDPSLTLLIDPALTYSTYFGLGGTEIATDVAYPPWCPYPHLCDTPSFLDYTDAWTAYVAGTTSTGGQGCPADVGNVFVLRLRSEGKEVLTNPAEINAFEGREEVFLRYICISGEDRSRGIAVGPDGSAYVVGRTLTNTYDAFIAKVTAAGSVTEIQRFGGDDGYEEAWDIALDEASNRLIVVGTTSSQELGTINAYQPENGGDYGTFDAFIAMFDASTLSPLYLSFLGGQEGLFPRDEVARSVAVLDDGSFVVAGSVESSNFLSDEPNSHQAEYGGGTDAFVARFTADGQDIVYWTYLGGPGGDHGLTVGLDNGGNALVGGTISSREIPGSDGVIQPAHAGGTYDGFLARFNRDGPFELFSYLGGSGHQDAVNGVSTDITGAAYLAGYTSSDFTGDSLFPTTFDALQRYPAGGDIMDAFLTKVGPSLESLYSSYLGGQGDDAAGKVTFWRGRTVLVGGTSSVDFPTRVPLQDSLDGNEDAFLSRLGRRWTQSAYVANPSGYQLGVLGSMMGRSGASGVVILDFGRPRRQWVGNERVYGASTWMDWGFTPTLTTDPYDEDIDSLVRAFVRGWWVGMSVFGGSDITPDPRLTVVVGTSNFCAEGEPCVPPDHAQAWAELVNGLRDFVRERGFWRITIAGGLDAQLAWVDGERTTAWLHSYRDWFENRGLTPTHMYDFGSCEGCERALSAEGEINPTWDAGTWTIAEIWDKAYGTAYSRVIPEIYTPNGSNARQWYVLSRYAQEVPPGPSRGRILFSGALAECQSEPCPGPIAVPPDESWWQLFEALYGDPRTRLSDIPWLSDIQGLLELVGPEPCWDC